MNKTIFKAIILIALLFVGNRLFNHVSAWGGIVVSLISVFYLGYIIIKLITSNKNNHEQN